MILLTVPGILEKRQCRLCDHVGSIQLGLKGFGVHSHHQEGQNDLCYLDLEEWLLPALGLFPDIGTRFKAFLGDENYLGWQHYRSPMSPHPWVKLPVLAALPVAP